MRNYCKAIFMAYLAFYGQVAYSVTGVNPSGVNVSHTRATTVFLTFRDLDPNETSIESFWCGAVITTAVSVVNPCVPGTIFGKLPIRLDKSKLSASGAFRNFTDIMTIPSSVARRAFIDAKRGNNSDFFYVRRFTGGNSGDRYVTVTCRLAGNGARVPFSLIDVEMMFLNKSETKDPVYFLTVGQKPEKIAARILYNGTGRIKGRWELVLPGDPEPTELDLLTEGSLPIEQRALQRRYTVLDSFDIFLSPKGEVTLPGPDPSKIPTAAEGAYKILLRIDATREKESNSNTGAGTVVSGGVSGFPMPVLRYYVGSTDLIKKYRSGYVHDEIRLVTPEANAEVHPDQLLEFSWTSVDDAQLYRIEINDKSNQLAAAIVSATQLYYMLPPWVRNSLKGEMRWSVVALDKNGELIVSSETRKLSIK